MIQCVRNGKNIESSITQKARHRNSSTKYGSINTESTRTLFSQKQLTKTGTTSKFSVFFLLTYISRSLTHTIKEVHINICNSLISDHKSSYLLHNIRNEPYKTTNLEVEPPLQLYGVQLNLRREFKLETFNSLPVLN